ncbi:Sensor histidine kinase RcsC [Marinomonas spartinae]|uniref:Sensor histidine kinase RcsC n=1 Tax=Marinomonas spartinae TaxID=1792290 RepID=A0A1A8T664_9GAMM|nr:response regulator [Marinomonas spartinae]SBS26541.1 Sensor histidine kinase RcsC [Marinomonas spartinae]SBS40195.1 Sensor histidine kinase RcsC [Marinomonas spartinae]
MSTRVLICDDSSIARRQLAKALPVDWDIQVDYAENGQEALDIIASRPIDVLFLDLNMPVKDGYQTLEALQHVPQAPHVFVVSGDVQPKAVQRVKELGASEFHKKPIRPEVMRQSLLALNLMVSDETAARHSIPSDFDLDNFSVSDCLQEVSNVAMGRAASVLADMLNVFIKLPVPSVHILEVSELQMALDYTNRGASFSAVSQGFVGAGVALEALLIFNDASFSDMAKLLGASGNLENTKEIELLMDVASVLVGPYMDALGKQMDIDFSYGHPSLLGQHVKMDSLISAKKAQWKRTLTVEIVYEVENYNICCDLLLLFTEDSVPVLEKRLSYLVED